jgi:serine/threonine-protein kinase RsbW
MESHKEILRTSFPSLKDDRKRIIDVILGKIAAHKIEVRLSRDEMYLVVDEALTNAMEHGNNWDPGKMVTIGVKLNNNHLNISIEDEGTGFNTGLMNNGFQDRNNLTVRGRGIKLIRQFCRPVWNSRGNRIELIIDLKA